MEAPRASVQEAVAVPVPVVPVRQRPVMVSIVVMPIGDALDGSGPGQCGYVVCGHVGGPRLRSHFRSASIYGEEEDGKLGRGRNCEPIWQIIFALLNGFEN